MMISQKDTAKGTALGNPGMMRAGYTSMHTHLYMADPNEPRARSVWARTGAHARPGSEAGGAGIRGAGRTIIAAAAAAVFVALGRRGASVAG